MATGSQRDVNNTDGPSPTGTARLIRFAASTSFADLPPAVVRESKRSILDFLGTTIGGAGTEAARIMRATVQDLGGAEQARVLAYGDRTSVTNAALLNGVLSHVLDFDDTHLPTILHPTGPAMAAALPVAEWKRLGGRALIAAHAVAVEVGARMSVAVFPDHYDRGWHMTGTMGTLGAATAAAHLLGLGAAETMHAVGIAATQAAGHRAQFGAMTKSLHSGKAASNGVLSALLASNGYKAAADSLEGKRGMLHVMSTKVDVAEMTRGLGDRWEIFRNGFKPYACGVVTHPGIDAVRLLGKEDGIHPDEVDWIDLRVHPLVLELTGKMDPQTGLEGKFSISFACAAALIEGTAGPRQFTDETVRRPDVVVLRDRVKPRVDHGLRHTEAVAVVHLRNGRTVERHVEAARGTPENPMSDADLAEKFLDLVEPVLSRSGAKRIIELVDRLEDLGDAGEIVTAAVRS